MVRAMFQSRVVVAMLVVACSSPAVRGPSSSSGSASTRGAAASPDQAFAALSQDFLDRYLRLYPVDATQAGEHRYDAAWPDVSPRGDATLRAFFEDTGRRLAAIPTAQLGVQNRIDAQILADQVAASLYALTTLRPRDVDPMYYTTLIAEGLDPLVTRNFGTPASRVASLRGRLDGIPEVVAAAKQRLSHPSKISTETAIKQTTGLIGLVETELATRFGEQPELAASRKRAAAALHDFHSFLDKDLLARSDGSFRLGRKKFAKKLAFALQDDVDIDAIAAGAHALLAKTQAEMVATAKQIWSEEHKPLPPLATPAEQKAFVKTVLDFLAQDRPNNATIVADAKQLLDKATGFVREHDLVRVPAEPVAVIEMPEYRRGVAVAYCDSSGPLEATPETFFAISPTPADWSRERAESFYREYNHAMLADLVVHEAMPGHYLQLMHNNRFSSKLRAVFSSGAFVEGWAVYSEWLMAEKGFGGPRVKLEREKMVLRLAANAILDHDIHAGGMEEKDALALMQGEAFQEEGEAVGKWTRARLTSAQLTTYYYGFTEFMKLRDAAAGKPGFTERGYHDRILSWGSPAMKFVRELEAQ
jgi:uncharacterized protein (DUF885 family)